MALDSEFINAAAPPGSIMQHALVYTPRNKRDGVTALLALCDEIAIVGRRISEPSVGHLKLQWWHDEFARLSNGAARHPITKAVQTECADVAFLPEYFEELINGAAMDLESTRYENFSDLALYSHRTRGMRHILIAEFLADRDCPADLDTRRFARNLGTGIHLAEILINRKRDLAQRRNYLPTSELTQHGVNAESLRPNTMSDELRIVLRTVNKLALRELGNAEQALNAKQHRAQCFNLVLCALYKRQLHELQRYDYASGDTQPLLGGWTKWWTSWRAARAAVKRSGSVNK